MKFSIRLFLFGIAAPLSISGILATPKVAYAGLVYQTRDVANAQNTYVSGINNLGVSVGYYNPLQVGPGPNLTNAVIWDASGNYSTFNVVGSTVTQALGINDAGQIAGWFYDGNGERGFLRNSDASYTVFNIAGAHDTVATGINDAGQIVGFYSPTGDANISGFVRNLDGSFATFNVAGAYQTLGFGINDAGQIVGNFAIQGADSQGFLRNSDGSYEILNMPGTSVTLPFGINNLNEVVGRADLLHSSFIRYADGSYVPFSVPDSSLTQAYGINDSGTIVGNYIGMSPDPIGHGFIATNAPDTTAVPEPSTIVIWSLMASVFGVGRFRKDLNQTRMTA